MFFIFFFVAGVEKREREKKKLTFRFLLFPKIFFLLFSTTGRPGPEADPGDSEIPPLDDRVVLAQRAERPHALLVSFAVFLSLTFFSTFFFSRKNGKTHFFPMKKKT